MSSGTTYYRARHVATMDAKGVIEDGCVVAVNGNIAAVGSYRDLKPPRVDHDIDGLLTPGLINAHTHLELSDLHAGDPPAGGFADWLIGMLRRSATEAADLEKLVAKGIAIGVEQCRRFGVTTVGDISKQCHLTRPLLAKSSLRVVSFGEVQAMAQRRGLLAARLETALAHACANDRLHIGLTPHAPYSVEAEGYRACLAAAIDHNLPLTTHLAESPDETPFLADHAGPFRSLWTDVIQGWDASVPRFAGGPIAFADSLGLLAYPTLLAHVNYVSDADLSRLAAGRATVVWCPRTHAYFGHPPHRWRDMRAAGITVCVGTDSNASSPDLNLMDDLRLIRKQCPAERPKDLWAMVTSLAADALRWGASAGQTLGRIQANAVADLVAWPTQSSDPLAEVLDTPGMLPSHVWTA